MCIFIALPESILGVYQFSCVDACIPIQYKCIDTNELYFYRILYYRDFTSRYISYRIVYSILIGAGCIYIHTYIYAYICVFIYVYVYIYMFICLRMHVTMYTWLYVCFLRVLILCMLILWFFFTYGCLVRDDKIKKFKQIYLRSDIRKTQAPRWIYINWGQRLLLIAILVSNGNELLDYTCNHWRTGSNPSHTHLASVWRFFYL